MPSRNDREKAKEVYLSPDVQLAREACDTWTTQEEKQVATANYLDILVSHGVLTKTQDGKFSKTEFGQVYFEVALEMFRNLEIN